MGYKTKPNTRLKNAYLSVLFLSGCATTGTSAIQTGSTIDPFEDFNRDMYSFNKVLDSYVVTPLVDAYTWTTPHFVQTGIGNFFSNLKDIDVMLNDLLQAKFAQGGEDAGRFLFNSTVGLGGLFDVASEVGLVKHEEDFDQTFAVWGIPQGPYLVLPVLGPTTGRGIGGAVLDTAANPASYVGYPIQALSLLNERANADSALKMIDEAALDPYVFTREAFLQTRQHLITDGQSDLSEDVLNDDPLSEVRPTKPSADKVEVKLDLGRQKTAAKPAGDPEKSSAPPKQ